MVKKIEKVMVNSLGNQEVCYLRKDLLGWHTVYPIKNEDGSINWKNLIAGGSWWKLGLVILFVIVMLGAINEFVTISKLASGCVEPIPAWKNIAI